MPPCLDVYALVEVRERRVIERFLTQYVDVEGSSDRKGEELAVLRLDWNVIDGDLGLEPYEWVPVESLEQVLMYGLTEPFRAFTVHLRALDSWCGAMLGFTEGGGVVLGVSVDSPFNEPSDMARAEGLMARLVRDFRASVGWVVCEEPPPLIPAREQPWNDALAYLPGESGDSAS